METTFIPARAATGGHVWLILLVWPDGKTDLYYYVDRRGMYNVHEMQEVATILVHHKHGSDPRLSTFKMIIDPIPLREATEGFHTVIEGFFHDLETE